MAEQQISIAPYLRDAIEQERRKMPVFIHEREDGRKEMLGTVLDGVYVGVDPQTGESRAYESESELHPGQEFIFYDRSDGAAVTGGVKRFNGQIEATGGNVEDGVAYQAHNFKRGVRSVGKAAAGLGEMFGVDTGDYSEELRDQQEKEDAELPLRAQMQQERGISARDGENLGGLISGSLPFLAGFKALTAAGNLIGGQLGAAAAGAGGNAALNAGLVGDDVRRQWDDVGVGDEVRRELARRGIDPDDQREVMRSAAFWPAVVSGVTGGGMGFLGRSGQKAGMGGAAPMVEGMTETAEELTQAQSTWTHAGVDYDPKEVAAAAFIGGMGGEMLFAGGRQAQIALANNASVRKLMKRIEGMERLADSVAGQDSGTPDSAGKPRKIVDRGKELFKQMRDIARWSSRIEEIEGMTNKQITTNFSKYFYQRDTPNPSEMKADILEIIKAFNEYIRTEGQHAERTGEGMGHVVGLAKQGSEYAREYLNQTRRAFGLNGFNDEDIAKAVDFFSGDAVDRWRDFRSSEALRSVFPEIEGRLEDKPDAAEAMAAVRAAVQPEEVLQRSEMMMGALRLAEEDGIVKPNSYERIKRLHDGGERVKAMIQAGVLDGGNLMGAISESPDVLKRIAKLEGNTKLSAAIQQAETPHDWAEEMRIYDNQLGRDQAAEQAAEAERQKAEAEKTEGGGGKKTATTAPPPSSSFYKQSGEILKGALVEAVEERNNLDETHNLIHDWLTAVLPDEYAVAVDKGDPIWMERFKNQPPPRGLVERVGAAIEKEVLSITDVPQMWRGQVDEWLENERRQEAAAAAAEKEKEAAAAAAAPPPPPEPTGEQETPAPEPTPTPPKPEEPKGSGEVESDAEKKQTDIKKAIKALKRFSNKKSENASMREVANLEDALWMTTDNNSVALLSVGELTTDKELAIEAGGKTYQSVGSDTGNLDMPNPFQPMQDKSFPRIEISVRRAREIAAELKGLKAAQKGKKKGEKAKKSYLRFEINDDVMVMDGKYWHGVVGMADLDGSETVSISLSRKPTRDRRRTIDIITVVTDSSLMAIAAVFYDEELVPQTHTVDDEEVVGTLDARTAVRELTPLQIGEGGEAERSNKQPKRKTDKGKKAAPAPTPEPKEPAAEPAKTPEQHVDDVFSVVLGLMATDPTEIGSHEFTPEQVGAVEGSFPSSKLQFFRGNKAAIDNHLAALVYSLAATLAAGNVIYDPTDAAANQMGFVGSMKGNENLGNVGVGGPDKTFPAALDALVAAGLLKEKPTDGAGRQFSIPINKRSRFAGKLNSQAKQLFGVERRSSDKQPSDGGEAASSLVRQNASDAAVEGVPPNGIHCRYR